MQGIKIILREPDEDGNISKMSDEDAGYGFGTRPPPELGMFARLFGFGGHRGGSVAGGGSPRSARSHTSGGSPTPRRGGATPRSNATPRGGGADRVRDRKVVADERETERCMQQMDFRAREVSRTALGRWIFAWMQDALEAEMCGAIWNAQHSAGGGSPPRRIFQPVKSWRAARNRSMPCRQR